MKAVAPEDPILVILAMLAKRLGVATSGKGFPQC
jgi:hypothetical protein